MNNLKLKILLTQNGPFAVLILIVLLFTVLNPRFFSLNNFQVIIVGVAELGILAMVFGLLLMAGGVDLSVGSVASLAAVVAGKVMVATDAPMVGAAAGLGVGLIAGAINGLLVSFMGLNPIVATLGALSAWGGLALFITNGSTVTGLPNSFRQFGAVMVGPVSIQIVLLLCVSAAAWLVLNRLPFGRHLLAVGGNQRAAHLMGVSVRATRLVLYTATGTAASIAGILMASRLNAASPTFGVGMEVTVLIIVLLGGVAFEGGSGRIETVVAGLLIIGALRNGLVLIGISQFVQTVLIGLTLILAVALDRSFQRIITSSWQALGRQEDKQAAEHPSLEVNFSDSKS